MKPLFLCLNSEVLNNGKALFLPLNKTHELCTDPLFWQL